MFVMSSHDKPFILSIRDSLFSLVKSREVGDKQVLPLCIFVMGSREVLSFLAR